MAGVIELTDKTLTEVLANNESAIVDIHASWCGPCRLFAPIFDQVSKEYDGKIGFFKIDGDENPRFRDNLTIENLPFVAAYRHGKFIKGTSTATREGLLDFINENFRD